MWAFVTTEVQRQFFFLEEEYAFGKPRVQCSPRQCSVEYSKEGTTIGIWSEYGTRPELFVKTAGKRVFINRLIAKRCPKAKSPVPASVFGRRFSEDDHRAVLSFFAEILRTHAQDILSGQVSEPLA
jgi:hypothetical protein